MKKTAIALVVLVLLAVGGYLYLTQAPSAPSVDVSDPSGEALSSGDVYRISQEGSIAEFRIYELLRGNPFTVVGTTTQIAGDLAIGNEGVRFGEIRINARTFKTDSQSRDGTIARAILRSENPANEVIVFRPTSVSGGEDFAETGSSTLSVSGDLTISGVTKPATFVVSMRMEGGAITGTASAQLKRSDFNLIVPNLDFIADVPDLFDVGARVTAVKVQ